MQTQLERTEALEELRSEVNLLTYPFFALTSKDVFKRGKTEFKAELKRNGQKFKIFWKVSANQEYGYPGPLAKKVHKAIEQVIEENGFPAKNPIQFSIYELCKKMNISLGGRQYDRIRSALKKIQFTAIESENAFYHKGRKKWITKTFTLYEAVIFKGEELDNGEIAESNYLYLNDLYLNSINSRYLKPLNFEYYKSLETNIARRLYELLGVKFYGIYKSNQPFIRYKYSTLCQLLPLHKQKYLSKAKHILEPAHKELKETNFLEKVNWSDIEGKEKDWYIYYLPGGRAEDEIEEFGGPPYFATEEKKPALTEVQRRSVDAWVSELSRKLEDEDGDNEGYYRKLGKLIVKAKLPEGLVRKCLSEAKSEAQMRDRDPEADRIENTSAYFTDLLKRKLKKKDKELNDLLNQQ
ncbi:replication initiator protein A [Candidatus Bipolaricaulota bacterium]|nr:replication initiator protein A [Candidatus Bipolaricaulota bacterium]